MKIENAGRCLADEIQMSITKYVKDNESTSTCCQEQSVIRLTLITKWKYHKNKLLSFLGFIRSSIYV